MLCFHSNNQKLIWANNHRLSFDQPLYTTLFIYLPRNIKKSAIVKYWDSRNLHLKLRWARRELFYTAFVIEKILPIQWRELMLLQDGNQGFYSSTSTNFRSIHQFSEVVSHDKLQIDSMVLQILTGNRGDNVADQTNKMYRKPSLHILVLPLPSPVSHLYCQLTRNYYHPLLNVSSGTFLESVSK